MAGRVDSTRTRYSYDCYWRDIVRNSHGRVQSLIVFNDKNEAYFESFTVFIESPVEKTVRVMDIEIPDIEKHVAKFSQPRTKRKEDN